MRAAPQFMTNLREQDQTHRQDCTQVLLRVPHAFKDLVTPETPQFVLNIAVCYVLHHYPSRDIHHYKIKAVSRKTHN